MKQEIAQHPCTEMFDDIMDMILLDKANSMKESISGMNNRTHADMARHEDHVNDRYIMRTEDFLRYSNMNTLI